MKKTVSALVVAALTLCAVPALYASPAAAAASKSVAAKKASSKKSTARKVSAPDVVTALAGSKPKAVRTSASVSRAPYWQCVTFARAQTGLEIFGDAWTWWGNAQGKYETGNAPRPGSVMVFPRQGKMSRGHVAVVSQIITERYIQITHANWSPINGRRGQVESNVNVMDVSEKNDWSKVRVWYGPLNDFGTTVYAAKGFIYQSPMDQARAQQVIAQAEDLPLEPRPYQQIASAEAEMPAALQAALTPGNATGFLSVKANTVAAHATGSDATALVARLDADKAAAAGKVATPQVEQASGATLSRP